MWQFREVSWGRESVLWDTVQGNFVTLAYAVVVILGTLYLVLGEDVEQRRGIARESGGMARRRRFVLSCAWHLSDRAYRQPFVEIKKVVFK